MNRLHLTDSELALLQNALTLYRADVQKLADSADNLRIAGAFADAADAADALLGKLEEADFPLEA